ncbi:MAG: LysM peptidoglycan-binding domain-containing protein [Microbacteriaceae bacterium]|nr:LysM peptidoglycan-binding domain-containing protein [Microbacteriaceae bacterium]
MTAVITSDVPPLTAATALLGLRPSVQPTRPRSSTVPTTRRERRALERRAEEAHQRARERTAALATVRRAGPVVALGLAGTLAITANITGIVEPVDARSKAPKPKPPTTDRGKTVREAFLEAKKAAATAAAALRATLAPPALYTVGEHDTLPDIAARYGLSTASLLALNGLSWSTAIHPGQVLKLTTSGPIAAVAPEASFAAVVPQEQRHTVAAGESLASVAARYGVDVNALLSANGFSPSSIIYPGQIVTIPPPPPPPAPVVEAEPEPEPEPDPDPVQVTPVEHPELGVVALDDEMRGNAAIIVQVGRNMGVPDYGIVIALATAAQESTLRNLDWGDRDSVGLFQQRPSQGWGTVEQLTDPWESSRRFYGGPGVPTRGLLDIAGWQGMPLTVAAQAVQNSAYPDAYAKWEASAGAWLGELS